MFSINASATSPARRSWRDQPEPVRAGEMFLYDLIDVVISHQAQHP
jgi:hypothetical protein